PGPPIETGTLSWTALWDEADAGWDAAIPPSLWGRLPGETGSSGKFFGRSASGVMVCAVVGYFRASMLFYRFPYPS
ncbi:MAG TPA: hypothetical protein PLQ00_09735, partial [Thermoguttaceae bacterium]|nr:hypothetical protein [Thermoguttaceae bacterium]